MQPQHPAIIFKICLFLLIINIFAACRSQPPSVELAEPTIDLGTYHLQPMTEETLSDLDPAYRLISVQDSGYLVSSDTGLTYAVDALGKITHIDKREHTETDSGSGSGAGTPTPSPSSTPTSSPTSTPTAPGNSPTRLFAASDSAVWSLSETHLKHSKGQQEGLSIAGDKVRVLWFSTRQILLWGDYQRDGDGGLASGAQIYSLDPSSRVKTTVTIGKELIEEEVPTFIGAEKFIAGGLARQDIWLWIPAGGLLLLREKEGTKQYLFEDKAKISFVNLHPALKDIGFAIQITREGEVIPPPYVLSIGGAERSSLSVAAKIPAAD